MKALIYLTSILHICYTANTKIKRSKNPEIDEKIFFPSKLKRVREQSDESFYSNLDSNKRARIDQIKTDIYNDEDCIKLFESLYRTDWVEPSVEELNKITPNYFLDSESIEKYFEMIGQSCISKQIKSHNEESNYKNHLNFSASHVTNFAENDIKNLSDEQLDAKIIVELDYLNCIEEIIAASNENLKLNRWKNSKSVCFEDFLKKFKFNIKSNYIKKIKHKTQINSCLERLKNLDEANIILHKYKLQQIDLPTVFNDLYDRDYVKKLQKLHSRFDKDSIFNRETCKTFFEDFYFEIFINPTSVYLRDLLNKLNRDQKKLLFNFELNKLHRYIVDVPEILIFGGFFNNRSFSNVAFIIHMIVLFIEKIGNTKNDKNFILCMVYITFHYYNHRVDMFKISYEVKCKNDKHNLSCFAWEFDPSLRKRFILRKRQISTEKDLIHFKIILSTWMYRTLIFLQYSDHIIEDVKILREYCDKKFSFKGCIGCFFIDFLNKVKIITEGDRLRKN